MAITYLDSFKYGVNAGITYNDAANWSLTTGRGGRHGMQYTNVTTTASSTMQRDFSQEVILLKSYGFAAYHSAATLSDTAVRIGLKTNQGIAANNFNTWLTVCGGRPVGELRDQTSGGSALNIIDASPTAVGWHWWSIEIRSYDSSNGFIRFNRDGVRVAEVVGDTRTTYPYNGLYIRTGNTNSLTFGYLIISDWIERDDAVEIPDSRVDSITLASTTAAGWTGSDGNQVDNHLLLNSAGPDFGLDTYVEAAAPGLTDTYTVSSLPAEATGDVLVVQATMIGAASDLTLDTTLSVNSNDNTGNSTQANVRTASVLETNPDTALAWTTTEVNSMTVGLKT